MLNRQKILSHISDKDEKIIFSKLIDDIYISEKKGFAYSDFYAPAVIANFISVIGAINCCIYGGYPDAERVMIGFYSYEIIEEGNFPITPLKISYNNKFVKNLTHRDFLGSILALQIDRSKTGDILIYEDCAIIFVHSGISDFIMNNLNKVKNASVKISKAENIILPPVEIKEKSCTAASLRLDAVISCAFNISRTKSASYVESEKVFVNWSLITASSKQTKEGDIITVRGLGRIKLLEVAGRTKKDRLSIKLRLY